MALFIHVFVKVPPFTKICIAMTTVFSSGFDNWYEPINNLCQINYGGFLLRFYAIFIMDDDLLKKLNAYWLSNSHIKMAGNKLRKVHMLHQTELNCLPEQLMTWFYVHAYVLGCHKYDYIMCTSKILLQWHHWILLTDWLIIMKLCNVAFLVLVSNFSSPVKAKSMMPLISYIISISR